MLCAKTQSVRWCDIEDLGDELQVKIGPNLAMYEKCGTIKIPYDQMESYSDPTSCCEECCGLCVGGWCCCCCGCYGGLQGLGMRSTNCKQRQIIITYRDTMPKFKRVAITVEPHDYEALTQLLDEKCGFSANDTFKIV